MLVPTTGWKLANHYKPIYQFYVISCVIAVLQFL